MALVSLVPAGAKGGPGVVSGAITMPRLGAWHADLQLEAEAPAGRVEIRIGSAVTLKGTVVRSGVVEGIARARVVAGAGAMPAMVQARQWTAPTLRNVLTALLGDVGEALSAASDAGILANRFEHWTTQVMSAGAAIRALVARAPAGTVWRHREDGTVWVGRETWPASKVKDFAIVREGPEDALVEVGLEQPTLLPGTTLGGRRIDTVEMRVTGGAVTATIWEAPEGETGADRLRAALPAPDPFAAWQRTCGGKVRARREAINRVDMDMDDPRLPKMSNIPLLLGVPGWEVTLALGHQILVGWRNGWPDQPYAIAWEPGQGGGVAPAEPVVKGASYRGAENLWLTTQQAFNDAVAAAIAADPTMPAPNKAAVAAAAAALGAATSTFKQGDFLSKVNRTK